MNTLTVFLHERRAGALQQLPGGEMAFQYDEAWLANPATPLSRSLPLQVETFGHRQTRAFFSGILPEEGPRRQIARILGISEGNDFAMLNRIGGECAGAVSLLPPDAKPPDPEENKLRSLTDDEWVSLVQELPRKPLMADMDGVRLSLAGAQDKLPVVVDGETLALPLGYTPSSHILKPEPDRFPGLAANEWFCMRLARTLKLTTPEVSLKLIGDKACLLVERFDRMTDDRGIRRRIHQEDFCQGLGFPPEQKYQAEGGPMFKQCVALLRGWSTTPVQDIPRFVDTLIFNVLIGNADAHGKNFSLLYSNNTRRLAPCYDLVSTVAWPELSKKLAMKIGRNASINAFTEGDWKNMAMQAELGWPMIRERIKMMSQRVLQALPTVLEQSNPAQEATTETLNQTIKKRANSLLEALTKQGI